MKFQKTQTLSLYEFIGRQHDQSQGYPARFTEVLNKIKPLDFVKGPWLAGGSIRRLFDGTEGESDFDIFFANVDQLNAFRACLGTSKVLYENELNVTLEIDVDGSKPFKLQLIKFYFSTPEAVLEWFDYTNCQFITDGNTLMVGQYTLYDIGRKHLRLNNIHHAMSTVRRMLKYARQGYTVCDGTINDILRAVADKPAIINEQIRYID